MTTQQFSDNPFFSIPQRKIDLAIEDINRLHLKNGKLSPEGAILLDAIYKYAYANIPVDYWWREMDNFQGSKSLVNVYDIVTNDIKQYYKLGTNYCFSSAHGLGKTFVTSCILKRVVENDYTALYVNLVDIINILANYETDKNLKSEARQYLQDVDFLVIDEFDSRFMGSDNASDLFGRIFEPIVRFRIQNALPTILCTNNTNLNEMFNAALQQSFNSLLKKFKIVAALGKDFRGNK